MYCSFMPAKEAALAPPLTFLNPFHIAVLLVRRPIAQLCLQYFDIEVRTMFTYCSMANMAVWQMLAYCGMAGIFVLSYCSRAVCLRRTILTRLCVS